MTKASMLPHDEPPEYGEIRILLPTSPRSRQANSAAKASVLNAIRQQTRPLTYLLDGYVFVDFNWHIHEEYRWESDKSADVDNVIKPMLDALCGPEGLLIDDCQVRSISSSWFASVGVERVEIVIKFIALEWLPKKDLVFVRLKDALCYPIPGEIREKHLGNWLAALKQVLTTRARLATLTGDYYPARYVLPHGFFHRTRLNAFRVLDVGTLDAEATSGV